MHETTIRKLGPLFLACALALAGCQGEKGNTGPTGSTGPGGDDGVPGENGENGDPGAPGDPGLSTGTLSGIVKVADGIAVEGAIVSVLPDVDVEATTTATGAFTLDLPIGVYSVVLSGPGISGAQVNGVSVVAGKTTTQNLVATYSPVKVTVAAPSAKNGAIGFNQGVELTATPTGGTAPYTFKWEQVTTAHVPTTVALQNATTEKVGFTTGKFAGIAARVPAIDDDYFRVPERMGLIAMSPQQLKYFTYTLRVTVTDAKGFKQSANATVPVGMTTSGAQMVARNIRAILNAPSAAAYDWTVTGPGGAVALDDKTVRNPSFVPTAVGTYTATVNGKSWKFTVGEYAIADLRCNDCHDNAPFYANVYKKWQNSAHGNRFHKQMEWDGDALVFKAGEVPVALINDVPFPWTAWTNPTRMTTFQYGMTNGEGAHYGENCIGCHAAGFNKLADNKGLDEAAGYVYPAASTGFFHDDGDLTKPDTRAWDALSPLAKSYAGMQCDACHGPIPSQHMTDPAFVPENYGFFDAQSCAVCHDSVGHHDRNMLFAQAGHANLELAIEEGTNTNCGRCHSAQGFVAWSKNGFNPNQTLAAAPATVDNVQPITCQACHDPHSTTLRVPEQGAITTTSGFSVEGAGAGQLCVVCHSNRRGARGDQLAGSLSDSAWYQLPHGSAQSDVFFGQNAFFMRDGKAFDPNANVSVHAYVLEGTCAGCHMETEHAAESLFMQPAATNHSFKVKENICADCHHSASLKQLQENVEIKLHHLAAKLGEAAKVELAMAGDFQIGTDVYRTQPDAITLGAEGQHGMALTLHWNAPVAVETPAAEVVRGTVADGHRVGVAITSIKLAGVTPAVNAFGPGTVFLAAYWNFGLIEEDQTLGAHNPGFTIKVLDRTISVLGEAVPAR